MASENRGRSIRSKENGESISLIDCDVHQSWSSSDEIIDRLPARFKERGIHAPELPYSNPLGFIRDDLDEESTMGVTATGHSDIGKMRELLLDKYDVDYAILTGTSSLGLANIPNREYAHALAHAYNEWLIETVLPKDDRFLGSLFVAPQHPKKSAEMIRDLGSHPRIVQVLLPGAAQHPYGNPVYWPIYEAAEDLELPVGVHPSRESSGVTGAPTGAGYPSTYFEWHTLLGTYYIGQVVSLITEGVFEKFPSLEFVFIEGGFGWVPHLMWRMDKNWKGLRKQTPWVKRPPSEYIIDHIWFTTQPIEEPENPEHLLQIFDMMEAVNTLMFASDYPHWDGDSPEYGLPHCGNKLKRKLLHENAKKVYGIEPE